MLFLLLLFPSGVHGARAPYCCTPTSGGEFGPARDSAGVSAGGHTSKVLLLLLLLLLLPLLLVLLRR